MTTNQNHWPSLKDNPIIIVVGFCTATAAGTATLYEKIIIPYQLKVQEVQIADLTRQLASMPNTEKGLGERDATIAKLRQENAALKQRALELSKDNVFSPDDPYPKAFRRVRIGDLFSKLDEIYPGQVKKDDPDYTFASVKVDDFFFSQVTFYYDEGVKPRRVTAILFHLNQDPSINPLSGPIDIKQLVTGRSPVLSGALKAQIIERYGPGKTAKRETIWNIRGLKLTLKDGGPFSIDKL